MTTTEQKSLARRRQNARIGERTLKITFDESATAFVLDAFGKKTSPDGFVVEKKDADQKVVTPRGEEIQQAEFAGIRKGSIVLLKTNIVSLVEAAEAIKPR